MSEEQAERLFLNYRGAVTGLVGDGRSLRFTTRHDEGMATGVYSLDVDGGNLSLHPLPAPGNHLVTDGTHLYAACSDRRLYRGPRGGGEMKSFGDELDEEPLRLALAGDRILVMGERVVQVLSLSGTVLQNLETGERNGALAADETGKFITVGTESGRLVIFTAKGESGDNFEQSGSVQAHDGAVSAILFESGEARVLSAGTDLRLNSTYVRGTPDTEDRGGSHNHEGLIRALLAGPRGRFYSAGEDEVVKAWPMGANKKRPASSESQNSTITHLAVCEKNAKPVLAFACEDGMLRLYGLDEEGRVGERVLLLQDVYAGTRAELKRKETDRREAALKKIAPLADAPALKIIAKAARKDDDHGLRVLAAGLLGDWGDRRAVAILDELIEAKDDAVRLEAFRGLRKHDGAESLRPMELALSKQKKNDSGALGIAAAEALGESARGNDQAMTRLVAVLGEDPYPVRLRVARLLEEIFDEGADARAQMLALKHGRSDIRLEALARLYERNLLGLPEVRRVLRRLGEDEDQAVRLRAFLAAILSRPLLARTLRAHDQELHRKLHDLENRVAPGAKDAVAPEPGEQPPVPTETLSEDDRRPLLEAMSGRSSDTALQGAAALADLGDERALGALLQLSREDSEEVRVEVCKSLRKLRDERALGRLRMLLHDESPRVRDAAFTALRNLETETAAIEAAFNTPDENVRRRGLKDLFEMLRREGGPDFDGEVPFLERALNDPALAVAREAFKGALEMGEDEPRLRFLRRSVHARIRRDVLTELRARVEESWVMEAILAFFEDPDPELRKDSLKLLQDKYKNDLLVILTRAMECPHADVREQAARVIAARPGPDVSELVRKGLEDDKPAIRGLMVDALIRHEARDELEWAMTSSHRDVRLRAASARALYGDEAALKPLLEAVNLTRPEREGDERKRWKEEVLRGLRGLRELASADSFESIAALLTSEEDEIRGEAARALAFICESNRIDDLRRLLSRTKKKYRRDIALALAYRGDSSGASLIFEQRNTESMLAALCLGGDKQELLLSYLDEEDRGLREKALLLLLLMEHARRPARPEYCMAALSSAHPRMRLLGARALENFANGKQFREFVLETAREAGEKNQPWKTAEDKLERLAHILTYGDARVRVFAFRNGLESLVDLKNDKDGEKIFEHRLNILETRFADEIGEIGAMAAARTPPEPAYEPAELKGLALGAYAGLSRIAGGASEARVRRTALTSLRNMVRADASLLEQVTAIFLPAFQDSQETVREQAFQDLIALGVERRIVASEALESGQADLGRKALEMLGSDLRESSTMEVLDRVFREFEDGLEAEAARILSGPRGEQAVLRAGLNVRSQAQRKRSLAGLTETLNPESKADEGTKEEARRALREAMNSRYRDVVRGSVMRLAELKDEFAFDGLGRLLASEDGKEQEEAIRGFRALGDERAAEVLLKRIQEDNAGTAKTKELFRAIGDFRLESAAPALAEYIRARKNEKEAFDALLKISGYDQKDPPDPLDEDENASRPREPEKEHHPRRDAVLALLMKEVQQTGDENRMAKLSRKARFAQSTAVDPVLIQMSRHPMEDVRLAAVEVVGKRLKDFEDGRGERREALVKALEHGDGETRFAAARGLALGGFNDGLNILLTSVDLLPDYHQRRQAVLSLGRLADPRALDTLMRFVNDSEHDLHAAAVQAIGHMHATDKADEILELLTRMARGTGYVALDALTGLRWFNTRAGWEVIRSRAFVNDYGISTRVAQLLRFHDDPVALETLGRIPRTDSSALETMKAAMDSLRFVHGKESLEPIYIALESNYIEYLDIKEKDFTRLREEADAGRLLKLLPSIPMEPYREVAMEILLTREPLPVDEAGEALKAPEYVTLGAAAWVLGRAGMEQVGDGAREGIQAAGRRVWEEIARPATKGKTLAPYVRAAAEAALSRIIWALGRLRSGFDLMLSIMMDGEKTPKAIRLAAANALALRANPGDLELPEAIASEPDPDIRRAMLAVAARTTPDRIDQVADRVSDDGPALNPLLSAGDATAVLEFLRKGAAVVHNQGVLLPHLINQRDVEGLTRLLMDETLNRDTRMGAVEALAAINSDAARDAVLAFAGETQDVELRMTAWRSLRRAERRNKKRAAIEGMNNE